MKLSAVTAVALVVGLAMPAGAQWLKDKTPGIPRTKDGKPKLDAPAPRAPNGKPDLSGLWRVDPGGYGDNIVLDLKPGEVLPWADALFRERSAEFGIGHPLYKCMPEIGPFYNFGMFKMLQTPGTLGVLSEAGVYRQILTDGRALPVDPNPTWKGYSVGRWDGDTLVVTSAGFNDRTWLDFQGHPHTEALRVTERYRRKNFGELSIEMTFEDPKAYTRPWTIALVGHLAADTELLEFVCNENEKSSAHFVVTDEERRKAREKVVLPPEVLSRYEGTYEMVTLEGRKVTFTVERSGEGLLAKPPQGGAFLMLPESETVFSVSGARIEFFLDAAGRASRFVVKTVEGDQVAVRK
jgi:hypothetical protein